MQKLFLEWSKYDTESFSDSYIDPFDIGYLREFHKGIDEQHSPGELIQKVKENVVVLEEIATEVFRLMSNKVYGTPMNMKVDPYAMSLETKPEEVETGVLANNDIKEQVQVMWFYKN
jgi:hypothetical protein